MESTPSSDRLARRLRWYRENRGLTQAQVAAAMGFKDRQILAAVEAGDRRVSPEELVRATNVLGVELEDLLDPFRLVGEGDFSFRTEPEAEPADVEDFAGRASRWIATYRELSRQEGIALRPLTQKLDIRRDSSFEQVQASAESLWKQWSLGDIPALVLEEAATRELGVVVLHVEAPKGISGAASQLPGLRTILINRRESRGRRMFDLAHELFHILTWDAMPPERVESREIKASKGNRVEQLASNFASALLMPEAVVSANWQRRGELDVAAWVLLTAKTLCVSPNALRWRLVNLKVLTMPRRKPTRATTRTSTSSGSPSSPTRAR